MSAAPRIAAPRIAAPLAALLLAGCGLDTTCVRASCVAPREPAVFTGEAGALRTLNVGCCTPEEDRSCGANGAWWFDVVLEGSVRRVALEVLPAGEGALRWSEEHALPILDRDPEGLWEQRGITLDVEGGPECTPLSRCADLFEPGSTSLFACVPTGPDSPLSFRMRLYESGQSAPVACYAWGDPEGLPAECTLVEPTF